MLFLCYKLVVGSVGDLDPQNQHVFGLLDPDPDPLIRGKDPDPDNYLFS